MKKYLCVFYALMLLLTWLAACTADDSKATVPTENPTAVEQTV